MTGKTKRNSATAPLSLRERNRLHTRRELLDAALEVFTEAGYGSATVEHIAARAGASKVTLYSYFPRGREELFRELYNEVNTELIDRANAIYAEPGDFRTRIIALTETHLEIAQRPLIGRFYSIDDPAIDDPLRPVPGHASRVCAGLVATDLLAARERGELTTTALPEAVAELLVGAWRAALSDGTRAQLPSLELVEAMAALISGL